MIYYGLKYNMLSRLGALDLGHLIDNLGQWAVTFTVSVNTRLMKGFFLVGLIKRF